MTVADLKTDQGVKALDAFFADRSYAEGFTPSQADLALFEALAKAPGTVTPHALRWYTHIKSYSQEESKKFPGIKKAPAAFGAVVVPAAAPAKADDNDDVDLFGSDEEEESAEAAKLREERVSAYTQKKSAKPALIAKSSIVLEVKPWDDETDMKEMEEKVRSIAMDGLLWGAGKLVPVGYGIQKLQISCVVVDDLVSIDLLQEEIQNFEDFVQSVDIAAFNKI